MPTKPTGRPRGRPPGSKNTPTLAKFVIDTLQSQVPVPPIKKGAPRGPWAGKTPEERTELARQLAARSNAKEGGRRSGVPRSLSVAEHEARKAAQVPIVKRVMRRMADEGLLPEDPMAAEAIQACLMVLRTQESARLKTASARLILEFTQPKPAAKASATAKTAEEYLAEVSDLQYFWDTASEAREAAHEAFKAAIEAAEREVGDPA